MYVGCILEGLCSLEKRLFSGRVGCILVGVCPLEKRFFFWESRVHFGRALFS